MTLDAGGTNMVFGAMKGGEFCCEPITLPSNADNLDRCLGTMVKGFRQIEEELGEEKPVAISFCFPGPADYPDGIIGGYLPNFPSFRDGVALGPSSRTLLESRFISIMTATFTPMARLSAELSLRSMKSLRRPAARSVTTTSSATRSAQVWESVLSSTVSLTVAITPAWRLSASSILTCRTSSSRTVPRSVP